MRSQNDWEKSASRIGDAHAPVLLSEVLRYLNPLPGQRYVDATADGGGHAVAILQAIQPDGKLLALEWDEELLRRLRIRLEKECSRFSKNYELRLANFADIAKIVRSLAFGPVAGVLFDFGMSSFQLEASSRGFSFQKSEPLDMRYSMELPETAADMLHRRSPSELERMFSTFGQERFSRSIARAIAARRKRRRIQTTDELVDVIRGATPHWYHRSRLHFATKIFQAIRITVNHELENIAAGLRGAVEILAPAGRIVAISFHSLEDRTVKDCFRSDLRTQFRILTPVPVRPSREEVLLNPRARSARLRAFEKIA